MTPLDYVSADQALEWLIEGNKRFVNGKRRHERENATRREKLIQRQCPFAVVLACSDSRVPVELLFDQGFGDLFVIRVAGNVIGENEVGSIEFAVAHLRTELIFVLGHQNCGAVTAALEPDSVRANQLPGIRKLLGHIDPALEDIDPDLEKSERIRLGVEANVRWSMTQLGELPEITQMIKRGRVRIVGGVYDLNTGKVEIIETGHQHASPQ